MRTYKVKINNQPIKLNNNKIEVELTEEQLDDLVKQRENKRERFFFPEEGEQAWHINNKGITNYGVYEEDLHYDYEIVNRGVFRTEAQAKKEDEKRLSLVRLWKFVQENGLYFEPDWSDECSKYSVRYYHDSKKWDVDCFRSWQYNFHFPHFKTSSDCQKFIDNNLSNLNLFI